MPDCGSWQLRHWIKGFGDKRSVLFAACVSVIILSGCSHAFVLELLNEGDETVQARDFRNRTVAVESMKIARVDLPGTTLVLDKPQQRSFDLQRVPAKHVHSVRLVVYAILAKDNSLYVATKTKDGKLEPIRPQPDGFPLKGEKLNSKLLEWISSQPR
jgi:hypothetical protein